VWTNRQEFCTFNYPLHRRQSNIIMSAKNTLIAPTCRSLVSTQFRSLQSHIYSRHIAMTLTWNVLLKCHVQVRFIKVVVYTVSEVASQSNFMLFFLLSAWHVFIGITIKRKGLEMIYIGLHIKLPVVSCRSTIAIQEIITTIWEVYS
jgi:hypothetical protein